MCSLIKKQKLLIAKVSTAMSSVNADQIKNLRIPVKSQFLTGSLASLCKPEEIGCGYSVIIAIFSGEKEEGTNKKIWLYKKLEKLGSR